MTEGIGKADIAATGRRIARAMLVITFYWVFLKFGGFLMFVLVAHYFGEGPVSDAFTATYNNLIYLLLYSSALKTVLPAFMPLFAERRARDGESSAWALANTVVNLLLMATALLAVLGFVFAPQIVSTLLPGFVGEARAATIRLLRWMLPGTLVLSFAIMAQGVLNSYKSFSYPSAADAAQKLLWVAAIFAGLVAFRPDRTSPVAWDILGGGFLVGCVAQAALLLAGLRSRLRLYRPRLPALSWRRILSECAWLAALALLLVASVFGLRNANGLGEEEKNYWTIAIFLAVACLYAISAGYRAKRSGKGVMARFAFLAAPLLVGVIFARYRDLVSSFFQSGTPEGAYSLIEFAKKVVNLPSVLIGYSLGVAMLPFLCDMAARRHVADLGRLSGRTLRIISLFFLPLTVLTITLSAPIMQLLFDPGEWSPDVVRIAQVALGIPAVAIFFLAVEGILMQTFFSLQRTMLPTAVGVVFSLLHGLGLYLVIERLGFDAPAQKFLAVCIVYPLSRGLKNIVLFCFLQHRVKMIAFGEGLIFGFKLLLISIAVAATAWAVYHPVAGALPPGTLGEGMLAFKLVKAVHLAAPAMASLALFLGLCLALRMDEFHIIVRWIRERGWKQAGKPPRQDGSGDETM